MWSRPVVVPAYGENPSACVTTLYVPMSDGRLEAAASEAAPTISAMTKEEAMIVRRPTVT